MALLQMSRKITSKTRIEQIRERICKLKRKQSNRKTCRIVACGMGQPKDPNEKNKDKKKNNGNPALRKSKGVEPEVQTKSRKMNNPKSNSDTGKKLKATKKPRSTKTKHRANQGKAQ